MSRRPLIPLALAALLCGALAFGDDTKDAVELESYMLVADELITREEDAADAIYHASDMKKVAAKLKDLGVKPPESIGFPAGGLFVLVVSDHTGEAFNSLSTVEKKRLLIVDLKKDDEGGAAKPDAAPEGKKNSRVLLVACPPQRGVKSFAIKTADGKLHEVKGTDLAKKEPPKGTK